MFDRRVAPHVYAIYTVAADGRDLRRITFGHHDDSAPDWSPDGRSIVFTRGDGDVYRVAADGTGLRMVVAHAHAEQAVWAPDGRRIAYVDSTHLFVVSHDGTGRHRIAAHEPGDAVDLAW